MENKLVHTVPTHIEVKDKVVLGLDFQQFCWLFIGLCLSAVLYNSLLFGLPFLLKLGLAALISGFTLALAVIKPQGDSLLDWLFDRWHYRYRATCAIYGLWELQETEKELSEAEYIR